MGSNDRCNLRTNLLFQTSSNSQNCASRVSLLLLSLFLALESRCGTRHSSYQISNVIKLMWIFIFIKPAWLRSSSPLCWCYTTVGDYTHPRVLPLAMLTMKKETLGFHNFFAWFCSVCPISIGMGLHSRSPSDRQSSVTKINRKTL